MSDKLCDPFTMVYDELLRTAAEDPILLKHVKKQNFVALQKTNALKANVSSADLPEIVLFLDSIAEDRENGTNSSTTSIVTVYNFLATSGTKDLRVASNIMWGLYVSQLKWTTRLAALQYNNERFVDCVFLDEVETTLEDDAQNRGLAGFSVSWPVVVRMIFKRSNLGDC